MEALQCRTTRRSHALDQQRPILSSNYRPFCVTMTSAVGRDDFSCIALVVIGCNENTVTAWGISGKYIISKAKQLIAVVTTPLYACSCTAAIVTIRINNMIKVAASNNQAPYYASRYFDPEVRALLLYQQERRSIVGA